MSTSRHAQSNRYNRTTAVNDELNSSPVVLQITLGLLGLWFPYYQPASCTRTSETGLIQEKKEIAIPMETSMCGDEGCKRFRDGDREHFNQCDCGDQRDSDDEELSANKHDKGCLSIDVFAFTYLGISCSTMMYDLATYLRYYWGRKQDTLHLVSYCTYLLQVMVIPFWCFYARVLYHTIGRRRRRGYPLHRAFLTRRVTMLGSSRFGAKGLSCFRLLCFLFWPVGNAVFRIVYHYMLPECGSPTVHSEIGIWSAFLGYMIYGCFCYLIYIERLSFECEAHQISRLAREQAVTQNVDAVRRQIRLFYAHYHVLRKQIRKWMAFTMVVATWGLTAHLTWNYLIFSTDDIRRDYLPKIHALNILVSSQKIMFFIVPCVALGGLNLEHVWKRFRRNIAQSREHRYEAYWKAINKYVHEIDVGFSRGLIPTLMSTAIGLYLGLHLEKGHQNYKFWIEPSMCNSTFP